MKYAKPMLQVDGLKFSNGQVFKSLKDGKEHKITAVVPDKTGGVTKLFFAPPYTGRYTNLYFPLEGKADNGLFIEEVFGRCNVCGEEVTFDGINDVGFVSDGIDIVCSACEESIVQDAEEQFIEEAQEELTETEMEAFEVEEGEPEDGYEYEWE